MSTNSNRSGGIGFVGVLAIVFITLKLLGKITWSWFWVLAPIWISFGFAIALLLIAGICLLISYWLKPKIRARAKLGA